MILTIQWQNAQLNDKVAVRIRTCGMNMGYGKIEITPPYFVLVLILSDPGCPMKGSD